MNNVTNILTELADGEVSEEMDRKFQELHEAVNLTGKPGVLTIKVKLTPTQGKHNVATIGADISVTKPKLPLPDTVLYDLGDGIMRRNDPNQPSLFRMDGAGISIAGRGESVDTTTGEVTEE